MPYCLKSLFNTCNILVYYCIIRTNSWKDKQGQSPWQHKQCTLNYKQRKHRTFYFTKLSDWMKVVKTKSCCHEMVFNLLKGNMERKALKFIWHIYWISFVCLQASTLAPAPPITAPQWSSSPLPPTLHPPPPPICPPDNTDWTVTSAALTTCPRWLPWTARETGESSVDV